MLIQEKVTWPIPYWQISACRLAIAMRSDYENTCIQYLHVSHLLSGLHLLISRLIIKPNLLILDVSAVSTGLPRRSRSFYLLTLPIWLTIRYESIRIEKIDFQLRLKTFLLSGDYISYSNYYIIMLCNWIF